MTQQKILIVEDRSDWQDILCSTLTGKGYHTHSAQSFQQAVDALHTEHFHLAVVDPVLDMVNRFNRDGLSVIQKIGELQPGLPAIILTGSLTHDMELTLHQLYPTAPIFFKERWDSRAFVEQVGQLLTRRPAAPSPAGPTPPAALPPEQLDPPPAEMALGRPRVLLVENRPDWQQLVAAVLDNAGYFWRIAASAPQALTEMEAESFHLVILDLKLQQANLPMRSNEGWLLLDYLVERHPQTKVIILSGKAGPGDVADLLTQYPVIGYIEKQTFSPQAVIEAVKRASRAPELRIQTLGQFQIWRDGQAVGVWERPQAETIVKLLLVRRARGERAVAADELITRLWPDADEESGRKKLLPLISNARRTIEPEIEPRDSNFIRRSAGGYYFDISEAVMWDLLHFREHLREGLALFRQERWAEAVTELENGRSLYKADFLAEDRYTDWVIDIRREVVTEYCALLTHLAEANARLDRYPAAVDACEAALTKDPMQEGVYRRLMRLHYCHGEKGRALKVYRDCLTLFEELFGESPTPLTRQLHQAITNNEPIDCLGE
jgi:DNA-binding SARP family transcriptional activator/ActR/RegA family two-component response regulator